ncbi:hypothetical protein GNY84_09850 [Aeromonas hydrophila]|nr:hypothetical protein [Aeromonas hydrophila]MBQ4714323.1 hypothetical protein [Aeromonas hydrophila]MBW3822739.1 hypothetical protein [Aeromonas hydrophila]MBW5269030.1 hypothetical protein [Aeromonas hydrophila]QSR60814.1 hypothetical protein GO623_13890 [Aeromonas hydrophila]
MPATGPGSSSTPEKQFDESPARGSSHHDTLVQARYRKWRSTSFSLSRLPIGSSTPLSTWPPPPSCPRKRRCWHRGSRWKKISSTRPTRARRWRSIAPTSSM